MAYRAALVIGGQRLRTQRFASRAAAAKFARGLGVPFIAAGRSANPGRVELLRDGKHVGWFKSLLEVAHYIHQNHSYSLDHALRYEGYSVRHEGKANSPSLGALAAWTKTQAGQLAAGAKRKLAGAKRAAKGKRSNRSRRSNAYISEQWERATAARRAATLKRAGLSSGWAGLGWADLSGEARGKLAAFFLEHKMDRGKRRRRARRGNPALFDLIGPGSRVTILTPHGSRLTGRAVMRSGDGRGWVLNLGGRHGTPGLAYPENVVKVSGGGGRGDSAAGALIRSLRGNPKRRRNAGKRRTKCQ